MAFALRRRFERWMVEGWSRRGLVYAVFLPLSWLVGIVARRRAGERARHGDTIGVPVVIVGNLIAGGAGKTPIVIALVEALRARGRSPGVIARGYRAHGASQPLLVAAGSDPERTGDEPVLVARRTGAPVAVHANRVAAAHALLAAHPNIDVIVSDDGLQHYALARTVELVVFDARGAGNGAFLPAGPLREPLDRSRDATLFSACTPDAALAAGSPMYEVPIEANACYALTAPATSLDTHILAGRRVSAYAGIAHPRKFFDTLRTLGATVDEHALPDHAEFSNTSFSDAKSDCIVITEKDAVKCARVPELAGDPRVLVLRIDAKLDTALVDLVMEKLDGPQAA